MLISYLILCFDVHACSTLHIILLENWRSYMALAVKTMPWMCDCIGDFECCSQIYSCPVQLVRVIQGCPLRKGSPVL